MSSSTLTVSVELAGLAGKIRDAIVASEDPDAAAIARYLMDDLDRDDLQVALRRGLELLVTQEARKMKSESTRQARLDAEMNPVVVEQRRRTKKSNAKETIKQKVSDHQQMIEERFFAMWKETPTGRKFLGECTADDLRYSRDQQRRRSEELLEAAARDERLAQALDLHGCGTVRELGYDLAKRAFGPA